MQTKKRVMIVEDEPRFVIFLALKLAASGLR
jgi:hypothetical protein